MTVEWSCTEPETASLNPADDWGFFWILKVRITRVLLYLLHLTNLQSYGELWIFLMTKQLANHQSKAASAFLSFDKVYKILMWKSNVS